MAPQPVSTSADVMGRRTRERPVQSYRDLMNPLRSREYITGKKGLPRPERNLLHDTGSEPVSPIEPTSSENGSLQNQLHQPPDLISASAYQAEEASSVEDDHLDDHNHEILPTSQPSTLLAPETLVQARTQKLRGKNLLIFSGLRPTHFAQFVPKIHIVKESNNRKSTFAASDSESDQYAEEPSQQRLTSNQPLSAQRVATPVRGSDSVRKSSRRGRGNVTSHSQEATRQDVVDQAAGQDHETTTLAQTTSAPGLPKVVVSPESLPTNQVASQTPLAIAAGKNAVRTRASGKQAKTSKRSSESESEMSDDEPVSDWELPLAYYDPEIPAEEDCEDAADFILKTKYGALPDITQFAATLLKSVDKRSTTDLYHMAAYTTDVLRQWQDEFIRLDRITAPHSVTQRRPVQGGRNPIDQAVYEDIKESILYDYVYDPRKLPGMQDPISQKVKSAAMNRELRQRKKRKFVDEEQEEKPVEPYRTRRNVAAAQVEPQTKEPPQTRIQKRAAPESTSEPPAKRRARALKPDIPSISAPVVIQKDEQKAPSRKRAPVKAPVRRGAMARSKDVEGTSSISAIGLRDLKDTSIIRSEDVTMDEATDDDLGIVASDAFDNARRHSAPPRKTVTQPDGKQSSTIATRKTMPRKGKFAPLPNRSPSLVDDNTNYLQTQLNSIASQRNKPDAARISHKTSENKGKAKPKPVVNQQCGDEDANDVDISSVTSNPRESIRQVGTDTASTKVNTPRSKRKANSKALSTTAALIKPGSPVEQAQVLPAAKSPHAQKQTAVQTDTIPNHTVHAQPQIHRSVTAVNNDSSGQVNDHGSFPDKDSFRASNAEAVPTTLPSAPTRAEESELIDGRVAGSKNGSPKTKSKRSTPKSRAPRKDRGAKKSQHHESVVMELRSEPLMSIERPQADFLTGNIPVLPLPSSAAHAEQPHNRVTETSIDADQKQRELLDRDPKQPEDPDRTQQYDEDVPEASTTATPEMSESHEEGQSRPPAWKPLYGPDGRKIDRRTLKKPPSDKRSQTMTKWWSDRKAKQAAEKENLKKLHARSLDRKLVAGEIGRLAPNPHILGDRPLLAFTPLGPGTEPHQAPSNRLRERPLLSFAPPGPVGQQMPPIDRHPEDRPTFIAPYPQSAISPSYPFHAEYQHDNSLKSPAQFSFSTPPLALSHDTPLVQLPPISLGLRQSQAYNGPIASPTHLAPAQDASSSSGILAAATNKHQASALGPEGPTNNRRSSVSARTRHQKDAPLKRLPGELRPKPPIASEGRVQPLDSQIPGRFAVNTYPPQPTLSPAFSPEYGKDQNRQSTYPANANYLPPATFPHYYPQQGPLSAAQYPAWAQQSPPLPPVQQYPPQSYPTKTYESHGQLQRLPTAPSDQNPPHNDAASPIWSSNERRPSHPQTNPAGYYIPNAPTIQSPTGRLPPLPSFYPPGPGQQRRSSQHLPPLSLYPPQQPTNQNPDHQWNERPLIPIPQSPTNTDHSRHQATGRQEGISHRIAHPSTGPPIDPDIMG